MWRHFKPADTITLLLVIGLLTLRGLGKDGVVDALLLATGSIYLGYHFGKNNNRAP